MARLLVAGCGFVGLELARLAARHGWTVEGWTRTGGLTEGVALRAVDLTDADAVRVAVDAFRPDAIVHCASSGRGGPDAYRDVYLAGIRNLVGPAPGARIVFTGSTSVYAQTDGSTVTEESPAEPGRETGRILLEAERAAVDAGGAVARLAGIYGPDRSAHLRKLLAGEAVLEGDGRRWINQIHRDDAASALLRLCDPEVPAGVYNVCDDAPLTQAELYQYLAARHDLPVPVSAPPDLERKRGWTHKRVSNARLRAVGWAPRYASYREAVEAGAV
jgi:nucleoside-diphosphate-sugar epimerase